MLTVRSWPTDSGASTSSIYHPEVAVFPAIGPVTVGLSGALPFTNATCPSSAKGLSSMAAAFSSTNLLPSDISERKEAVCRLFIYNFPVSVTNVQTALLWVLLVSVLERSMLSESTQSSEAPLPSALRTV